MEEKEMKQKEMIVSHASLVAEFAGTVPDERKSNIKIELQEIEAQLGMTPEEIAEKAIQIYKKQY